MHRLVGLGRGILRGPSESDHATAIELCTGLATEVDLIVGLEHHTRIPLNGLIKPIARIKEAPAPVCRSVRDHRLNIDLHLHLGHGESFDDESRRHGWYLFEEAADRVIDGDAIGPIGNVGRHFTDVFEACSRFFEQLRDIAHGLGRLAGGILRSHQAMAEVQASLATHEEAVASLDHHTHVVV